MTFKSIPNPDCATPISFKSVCLRHRWLFTVSASAVALLSHSFFLSAAAVDADAEANRSISPVLLTDVIAEFKPNTQKSQAPTLATPIDLAQIDAGPRPNSPDIRRQGSEVLGKPSVQLQGVYRLEGDDSSARGRAIATYPVTPDLLFGAVVDLTTGNAFSDTPEGGLSLTELYVAASPSAVPNVRVVAGLMDLTSYFDRNSFAKDGASHFFNLAFQTNPALSAAGLSSRPGVLLNWSVTDNLEVKAATFSSSRRLGDFSFDSVAAEIGWRAGTAIVRGTYLSSRDAGQETGFREIFDIPRFGDFGPQRRDREEAYGVNAELFIPQLNMGLFGRYGRYNNTTLGAGGDTYSVGLSFLDLFQRDDRLGLAYGRQLSDNDLRRLSDDDRRPDVLELYYDFRISPALRAAVTLQERNEFSETVLGFRIKTEFDVTRRLLR
ncbi:hypothetical protein H6F43_17930 [Leptolyngbya sp. FACHB-36]|uniref:carbohydrate porin n=1 Tax=Leptolyngbya sp. FACHB-36 TaxID=2692808 RepID=UPI0016816DF2|nr:carbohydrate porin [Leptolyngbya sp. FACHB-36]MBD2022060.1 hypothetical protein [Leptolyngbya sp. FACHB-36]